MALKSKKVIFEDAEGSGTLVLGDVGVNPSSNPKVWVYSPELGTLLELESLQAIFKWGEWIRADDRIISAEFPDKEADLWR
jgi:hypothetical protein